MYPEYNKFKVTDSSLDYKHTQQAIANLSSENNPFFGKTHTAEAKSSEINKGENNPMFSKIDGNSPMFG